MTEPIASPQSPCVRQCCLDEHDVCLGCGRQLDEILGWHAADAIARRAILDRAAQRRRARDLRRFHRESGEAATPPPPPQDPAS